MPVKKMVGVVGVGRMGGPIAQRILRAKWPLMVWDVDAKCLEIFERKRGVEIAPPDAMARECAVIFFVVPSSAEIADCLKGKSGVLQNAKKGLVIYDLTTSNLAETKKMARRSAKAFVPYLGAGMSGGPGAILKGELTFMIGGDAKVLGRTRKYLTPFVEHIFHLGDSGSGMP